MHVYLSSLLKWIMVIHLKFHNRTISSFISNCVHCVTSVHTELKVGVVKQNNYLTSVT